MPDLLHFVLYVILGGIVGALAGLFGIGGGSIAVPLLGLAFGLDQQHAQGTGIVMVTPTVLVGLWNYAQRGGFNRQIALALACGAVPFTYLGALIAVHAPSSTLRFAFGLFLLATALWFAVRTLVSGTPVSDRPRADWRWAALIGIGGGAVSGVFSVGGAVFAVPLLSTFFGFAQAAAQGLGLALVAPGTLVSLVAYAGAHDIDWGIGIPMAIGGTACVRFGVALAHRLPERVLRLLFCVLLAGSSIALLLKA